MKVISIEFDNIHSLNHFMSRDDINVITIQKLYSATWDHKSEHYFLAFQMKTKTYIKIRTFYIDKLEKIKSKFKMITHKHKYYQYSPDDERMVCGFCMKEKK